MRRGSPWQVPREGQGGRRAAWDRRNLHRGRSLGLERPALARGPEAWRRAGRDREIPCSSAPWGYDYEFGGQNARSDHNLLRDLGDYAHLSV